MSLERKYFFLGIALAYLIMLSSIAVSVEPFGASVNITSSQRAQPDSAGTASAQAGNVTELMITGYSVTQTWQGYFGNVSGTIQLANANDQVIYNWSLASPQGEVYSSTNSTVGWGNIQCFNFTANGSLGTGGETAGGTNLGGLNLTQIESRYNIASDDVDGINETFTFTDHDLFYTANLQFSANECRSTRVYSASGPIDQQFEEVLLYEPTTGSTVFASLLEQNTAGFDSGSHDFEMLVLEDGHGTDTATTNYYFYVEIE